MPAVLGYFMAMLYNSNNVVFDVSPLTTIAELEAGAQLCKLFGFGVEKGKEREDPKEEDKKQGDGKKDDITWGHITCDGTVANLESIW
jgi:hypothetical protein